jgi:hypothetical protein
MRDRHEIREVRAPTAHTRATVLLVASLDSEVILVEAFVGAASRGGATAFQNHNLLRKAKLK